MAIPSAQWRLTLDTPAPFATEEGCIRTAHCADFRDTDVAPADAWRDPITGIVMLTPSVLKPTFSEDFQPSAQFIKNVAFWRDTFRAVDPAGGQANLLATIKPAGMKPTLIQALYAPYLYTIAVTDYDTLTWGLVSNFTLAADAPFALHYHTMADEMLRHSNWFAVQWDLFEMHFSADGTARAIQLSPDKTSGTVIDTFNLCGPGDLYNRAGYFWFLPIPGVGLLVYHSLTGQFLETKGANASAGAVRGHLVKYPSALNHAGVNTMFGASTVGIAVNPYIDYVLGFQSITFASSGVYTDAPFDPGYPPSEAPAVSVITLPTAQNTVIGGVNTADNSRGWAPGDQQARVSLGLSTSDSRYTPFVYGYQVQWRPSASARAPAPLGLAWGGKAADRMVRIEFAEDEYARFEGSVDLMLGSAHGRQLAERGDATFLLEKSLDGGATWEVHAGGLARQNPGARLMMTDAGGALLTWYEATWTLKDFWERLDEIHQARAWAADGLTIGDGLNATLATSGFAPIAGLPSVASTVILPPVTGDQQFAFAPRVGDSGSKIAEMFLLFLRGVNADGTPREYRLRYDWGTQVWICEAKPQDTSASNSWTLTPFSDEESVANTARFETLELTVSPPEFNRVSAVGVSGTSANEAEIVRSRPLVNYDSLGNASSVDYLGRLVSSEFHALGLSDQAQVDAMACRIFDAAAHRRLQPKTTTPYWADGLAPLAYVTIRAADPAGNRADLFTGIWVKRRSYAVERDGLETMTLEMDSQWLGELEV